MPKIPSQQALGRKEGNQPRWTLAEILVLISAKRIEQERGIVDRVKEKFKTADQRWRDVQNHLQMEGVNRAATHCRSRWEKLITEFKKIYEYQSTIPSGQLGYFEMSTAARKWKALPIRFLHEWYEAMVPWVPRHRPMQPDSSHIMDKKVFPSGENGEAMPLAEEGDSPDTMPVGESPDLAPLDESPGLFGDDDTTRDSAATPVRNGPSEPVAQAGSERNCDSGVNGQRRKSPANKSEASFLALSSKFLSAVVADSEKRNLYDQRFLELERQKHSDLYALETRKHAEHLAQQEKLALSISGALTEMSQSLRFFAEEVSKKL